MNELNIEMNLRGHFLNATACGLRTVDNVTHLTRSILDACDTHGVADVLLDLRQLTGKLSIIESLSMITNVFPEMKRLKCLSKVTVLESKDRQERSRFFEKASKARGYNIRMFEDQNEAYAWMDRSKLHQCSAAHTGLIYFNSNKKDRRTL